MRENLIGMTTGRESRGVFSGRAGCRDQTGKEGLRARHWLRRLAKRNKLQSAIKASQSNDVGASQRSQDMYDMYVHMYVAGLSGEIATVSLSHSALYTAHGTHLQAAALQHADCSLADVTRHSAVTVRSFNWPRPSTYLCLT